MGMDIRPWTKKYAPATPKEVVGQPNAVKQATDFAKLFKQHPKNGMILYGPSGCGKSSLVHAIASERGYELLEVNASDTRNKDALRQLLGNAIKQRSFFSDGKVILIDEIDGISGSQDRGAVTEVANLIKETSFPIIITCVDPFNRKLKALQKVCTTVEMYPVPAKNITEVLALICNKEGITCPLEVLQAVARKAEGDVRAAINDLQVLGSGKKTIGKEDFDQLGERSKIQKIEQGLTTVFKSTDAVTALGAFDEVEEDMDERFLWLDYNLPHEYRQAGDLARAYGCLSRADVYRRRIRRRQHWRFLVYINALLTAGIATSKQEPYKTPPSYKQTTRLLRIWQVNMSQAKKKSIAQKLASVLHSSTGAIMKDFGYYQFMFQRSMDFAASVIQNAALDKDEIAWMKK
jgi:replication factor C large subunit